jgi:threonine/homoserine/homoserine lactone efflux protein
MGILVGLFATSFIVALSGALMPGPLLTATVSESSRHGPKAGPLLMVGHGILEIALIVLLFLGLAPLLMDKRITAAVSLVGSAILLWLAVGMLRSLPSLSLDGAAAAPKGTGSGRLILSGVLLSLSNPYWTIWWATIGLAYVLQAKSSGYVGVAVFFAGHIFADFLWYVFVSLAVGKSRRFFSRRIYRAIVGVCAGFLVAFAAVFLVSGVKGL